MVPKELAVSNSDEPAIARTYLRTLLLDKNRVPAEHVCDRISHL